MARQPKRAGVLKQENNLLQLVVYAMPHQKAAIIEQMEHDRGRHPGLSMSNTVLLAILEKAARRRGVPIHSLGPLPVARKPVKARSAARSTAKHISKLR